jgi:AraC-like DNA-binding protein
MLQVPVTRAAHVIGFCDILRGIGAPVQRYLAASKLPENLEEIPDECVNTILGIAFAGLSARREGIADIGWLWARNFSECLLSAELVEALRAQPTVLTRLRQLFQLSLIEDSHLRLDLKCLGPTIQVICDTEIPSDDPGMAACVWTQVAAVIEVIRSATTPTWAPQAVTFQTEFEVCAEAREAFPTTRIVTGAPHTSVLFPCEALAMRPARPMGNVPALREAVPAADELALMRRMMRPYLRGATPRIALAAEIFGMSPRTLQRRLQNLGLTYRQLIETTRFELAAELLCSTDARIIDIAAMLGYDDQSNFGRSFRRYTGTSPGRFRAVNSCQSNEATAE